MKLLKNIALIFVCTQVTLGQHDTSFFKNVADLQNLFSNTYYSPILFNDTSLKIIQSVSIKKRNGNLTDRSTYLEKQKELEERDYGLSFTGNYLENINPSIGDLEDNLIYQRKFTAGLQWDILDNGYFENKVQARILDEKIYRNQMLNDANAESYHYLERFDYTIFLFNKVKVQLLHERKEQLLKEYEIVNHLVLQKKLRKEELINLDSRLTEVESLIKVYQSYNDYLQIIDDSVSFNINSLPLIDLDYERIFSMLNMQTDSLLMSSVYHNYYSWYHQIQLNVFLRYNYYDLIGSGYRNFLTTGLNVSIPIPFNHKLQNEIEVERWKYENERMVESRINLHEDILNTGYEFRYKLKQFIGFYQKRKLFMERLRVEKVKLRLGDNNIDPLGGLDLYDDLLQIDIELVDLLQNLYLKALKIHSKIPHASIDDIVNVQTTKEISEYIDKKKRSVYVWSKTFLQHSPAFMAEYCIYNEFKEVVIAVSPNDSLKKDKLAFMQYAAENASVYFMIGDNNLIYDEAPEKYVHNLLAEFGEFKPKGIHLDVEPHTFDEWASEKQRLLNQYIKMVGKINVFCDANNLELSVSVPLHYGEDAIDKILNDVDQIYFMCYENVKTDYLVSRLTTYMDYGKDKIVVALRTEDFENRIALEEKIIELEKLTGLRNFAYHDLRRVIDFDRKSIE